MASDIQSVLVEAATADPDGISTAAAVGNNANLVIGGALADGGSVTFDEPRNVTITSAGDDSGISFTVTGTDEQNLAQTEMCIQMTVLLGLVDTHSQIHKLLKR